MPGDPLLSVRDLRTHFRTDDGLVRAVDGVSFDLRAGEILGVVGETGCGKTVTARSILGIVEPPGRVVGGTVTLDGRELTRLSPNGKEMRAIRGGEIGLVFQEPAASFSPVHTVGNQLVEAIRLHRKADRRAARLRAAELLALAGIPDPERALAAYAWQLSGGQRQRAMIAMALAGEPRVLIADEPTTALDVTTQAQILELIRDLRRRTGLAIMLITHDLGVIAELADQVAVMYLGRVVERGPVEEIFHAPQHPYTRALLDSIPSLDAPAKTPLPTITGDVPHPSARPPGCPFHPRCRHAIAGLCEVTEPAPRTLHSGHELSCHLPDGVPQTPRPVTIAEAVTPVTSGRTLLEVRGLRKSFSIQGGQLGRVRGHLRAVDDVSFDLYEGETLALVGESGSGKTTAVRCVLRALTPDAGTVRFRTPVAEVDLAALSRRALRPLRRHLQLIFQDPYSSLNPRLTVRDIIAEPLLLNGIPDRTERVTELLSLVGLPKEYLHRYPHAFSGGQRQRIGIARALALHPSLVVADEPVSALDVSVRAQTLNLLLELQREFGLSYLFVSHDLSVVKHISDRVAVMYAGQLVELGARDDVLTKPRHPYTASLLAAIPRPDPRSRATTAPPRGEPADPANPPAGCRFHPRCPHAIDLCVTEPPVWWEIAPGRQVRCHRATDLDLPTP
jgi:peptide/nickel transport system ATP-binding protein